MARKAKDWWREHPGKSFMDELWRTETGYKHPCKKWWLHWEPRNLAVLWPLGHGTKGIRKGSLYCMMWLESDYQGMLRQLPEWRVKDDSLCATHGFCEMLLSILVPSGKDQLKNTAATTTKGSAGSVRSFAWQYLLVFLSHWASCPCRPVLPATSAKTLPLAAWSCLQTGIYCSLQHLGPF